MRQRAQSVPGAEKIKIGPKKKIALVCSGGASKAGAFHLGVALALQEQGFKFYGGLVPRLSGQSNPAPLKTPGPMEISTFVGSSAGSMIATFLAAGYSLDNIFNSFLSRMPTDPADMTPRVLPRLTYPTMFNLKPASMAVDQLQHIKTFRKFFSSVLARDWDALMKLEWLNINGLFSTAGIEEYIRENVLPSNKFQDYVSDLFIVATQLNHSRKVVFGKYAYEPPPHDVTCQYNNDVGISEAVAASTALPFIFQPYPIKNEEGKKIYYIDGEIRDTLSTHVAVDAGADLVIASHTHQPYHFVREIGSLTDHGLPAIIVQSIYLLVEQKINSHIHHKKMQRNAINSVNRFCKESNVSEEHRRRICEILEAELHHRTSVDTIYIHPSPSDTQMFFGEHFSLSPKKLADIVRSGFRAAIMALRPYEFADRDTEADRVVNAL